MHLSAPLLSVFDEINTGDTIKWAARIIALIIVWMIVAILVRYLTRWIQDLGKHTKRYDIDSRDLKAIDRLLDYVVVFFGIIATLGILGWTNLLISTLTAAGVFTIIIGFAVKDVAANFISGIFILIDQPFVPGDFIKIGEHSGTVEDISLRTTTLITVDGPVLFIPNSIVAVEPTTNYSLAKDRRINFTLSIANDTDIAQALEITKRVLEDEEELLHERTQLVLVSGLREYAVDISVTCYAPKDTFFTLTSDLQQQVLNALQENNVDLAVPVHKNVYPNLETALMQNENAGQ